MSGLLPSVLLSVPGLALIDSIGGGEMILVGIIGLILFGGKGLPEMARTIGKVVREFKKATANLESEMKRAMNEEPEAPAQPPQPARFPRFPPAPPPAAPAPALLTAPEPTAAPPPSTPTAADIPPAKS